MHAPPPLTGSHLRTYQSLVQHPMAPNPGWRAIRAMLEKLGEVSEQPNGNLKVIYRGRTLVLHPPRTKEADDPAELVALQRYLQRAATAAPVATSGATQWAVMLDHREARVYRSTAAGSVPHLIRPHVSDESLHQPAHTRDFSRGRDKVTLAGFFEPLAGVLQRAGQILLLGGGTGTSSAMDQFVKWVRRHRPDLATRLVGSLVVDSHHLSEEQLLALARDFYALSGPPLP